MNIVRNIAKIIFFIIVSALMLAAIVIITIGLSRVVLKTPKPISSMMITPEPATLTTIVTTTMYNAVIGQCDADPLVTAGMYKIKLTMASDHRWVALSRDLLTRWGGKFNYGDKIQITNAGHKDGIYTIVDTMNKRFTNRMDILETVGTTLYKFENVKIERIS